jgi:hypothetical protein
MTEALRKRLFPTRTTQSRAQIDADAPATVERPLVTYSDPTAWMTNEERAFHTHGGVTR